MGSAPVMNHIQLHHLAQKEMTDVIGSTLKRANPLVVLNTGSRFAASSSARLRSNGSGEIA